MEVIYSISNNETLRVGTREASRGRRVRDNLTSAVKKKTKNGV